MVERKSEPSISADRYTAPHPASHCFLSCLSSRVNPCCHGIPHTLAMALQPFSLMISWLIAYLSGWLTLSRSKDDIWIASITITSYKPFPLYFHRSGASNNPLPPNCAHVYRPALIIYFRLLVVRHCTGLPMPSEILFYMEWSQFLLIRCLFCFLVITLNHHSAGRSEPGEGLPFI